MRKSYKGKYVPRNPAKYRGNAETITYRSMKERQMMVIFDNSPSIVAWASEEVVIQYLYDMDGQFHKYYIDFYIEVKMGEGIDRILIEYKPASQMKPPIPPKKLSNRYPERVAEYIKNQNKWKYARAFAEEHGMQFVVVNEHDLEKWFKRGTGHLK